MPRRYARATADRSGAAGRRRAAAVATATATLPTAAVHVTVGPTPRPGRHRCRQRTRQTRPPRAELRLALPRPPPARPGRSRASPTSGSASEAPYEGAAAAAPAAARGAAGAAEATGLLGGTAAGRPVVCLRWQPRRRLRHHRTRHRRELPPRTHKAETWSQSGRACGRPHARRTPRRHRTLAAVWLWGLAAVTGLTPGSPAHCAAARRTRRGPPGC
mmetsp:Transcript_19993/g.59378  ORF Transcript_19993/g.59378 Transcript_19993/m.59378 type:complete len:217 (+) Transcript_19993:996-1646(+)